jgi:N6-adenosine-specific RNA methylase IME4
MGKIIAPFPNKKYQIIYADPPWKYNDRRCSHIGFYSGAIGHFSLMDYKEIASLPVQEISNENCILFLWVTFPLLQEGLYVMKEWGFKYKTLGFSWIKTNKK